MPYHLAERTQPTPSERSARLVLGIRSFGALVDSSLCSAEKLIGSPPAPDKGAKFTPPVAHVPTDHAGQLVGKSNVWVRTAAAQVYSGGTDRKKGRPEGAGEGEPILVVAVISNSRNRSHFLTFLALLSTRHGGSACPVPPSPRQKASQVALTDRQRQSGHVKAWQFAHVSARRRQHSATAALRRSRYPPQRFRCEMLSYRRFLPPFCV